jgi:hypothetical protein
MQLRICSYRDALIVERSDGSWRVAIRFCGGEWVRPYDDEWRVKERVFPSFEEAQKGIDEYEAELVAEYEAELEASDRAIGEDAQ